jgi:hypothetical protein
MVVWGYGGCAVRESVSVSSPSLRARCEASVSVTDSPKVCFAWLNSRPWRYSTADAAPSCLPSGRSLFERSPSQCTFIVVPARHESEKVLMMSSYSRLSRFGSICTHSFQDGAPAGMSGKGSMRGPLACTLAARARRFVFALLLFGVGSEGSVGSAVFCVSMFSLRSIGKSWCKGSRGVVRKVPEITSLAEATPRNFDIPYMDYGRQMNRGSNFAHSNLVTLLQGLDYCDREPMSG